MLNATATQHCNLFRNRSSTFRKSRQNHRKVGSSLRVPKLDKALGIEVYAHKAPGISGKIRQFPEDFVVEEMLLDGSKATIKPKNISSPSGLGRYLICGLVKRNWDTLLAVGAIAQQTDMSQERIQIEGIKDANAV